MPTSTLVLSKPDPKVALPPPGSVVAVGKGAMSDWEAGMCAPERQAMLLLGVECDPPGVEQCTLHVGWRSLRKTYHGIPACGAKVAMGALEQMQCAVKTRYRIVACQPASATCFTWGGSTPPG